MKYTEEQILNTMKFMASMMDAQAKPSDCKRPNINPVNKELNAKRDRLDKIYIESEERMRLMMDWFFEHKDELEELGFKVPIIEGVIEEPNIIYMFENDGSITNFWVFLNDPNNNWSKNVEFGNFKFDIQKEEVIEEIILKSGSKLERQKAEMMVHFQDMFRKKGMVYKALMYFMTYYEGEVIEVDGSKSETRNKREARKIKRPSGSPIPLVKKTYIIKDFDPEKTRLPGAPRAYTKPDHEVRYRGHWRNLKSGKQVWVRERSAYKDKGETKPRNYKL